MKQTVRKLEETIRIVKKNNPDKSNIYILLDIIYNVIVYRIGLVDYRKSDFINISKEKKKQCIGKAGYKKMINYFNNEKYTQIFFDKAIFNKVFSKYIKRDFIDLRSASYEEFEEFIRDKEDFFVKPPDGQGGKMVEKVINRGIDTRALYGKLISNRQFIVEQTIIQHGELNRINGGAVNNLRVLSLLNNGTVHILGLCMRFSNEVDEAITSNDIMCRPGPDGVLTGDAYDDYFNAYKTHPRSGTEFKGFRIPFVAEALEMVKKAALEVPAVRYVGWDVAITPDGPLIIEGNFYPAVGLHQFYLINEDYPLKKKIVEIIGDEYENFK